MTRERPGVFQATEMPTAGWWEALKLTGQEAYFCCDRSERSVP
jgi:hypothetical protein